MAVWIRYLAIIIAAAVVAVLGALRVLPVLHSGPDGIHAIRPSHSGAAFGRAHDDARDGRGANTLWGRDAEREPGEVLVTAAPDDFRTRSQTLGYRIIETLSLPHLDLSLYRLRLPQRTSVDVAIARLHSRFPSATIDANHRYKPAAGLSLPESYARSVIGWDGLPQGCGRDLRLAMIDAAVDIRHPALAGARITYRDFSAPRRQPGQADHGTAIAAILVGQGAAKGGWGGLVPEAELLAANIFEVSRSGRTVATARGLIQAMDWVSGEQVDAVNLSIAGPDNRIVRNATLRAQKSGLVLIAAAGNWGSTTRPAYPAAYDDVIAVTAVAADGQVYRHANRGDYVDFSAPGVRLWTAVPDGGKFQSGTSFAAPYVTTLVSFSVSAGQTRASHALRDELKQDVVDLGRPGRDDTYGWGLIRRRPSCAAADRR